MAAFQLSDRFPPPPTPYKLLDPGAYNPDRVVKLKPNKAPFLSNAERKTQSGNKIWTHSIYHTDIPPHIPNATSFMSKRPRFPYEAFSKEDLEAILCRCGFDNVCECTPETQEEEPQVVCQAKMKRRIFIGHPPRSEVTAVKRPKADQSPPFYDAVVKESTAFYQGCKWSKWTSSRAPKHTERSPGPADYTIQHPPTQEQICAERVREDKRKHSKQLRFIEMVQQRNILEGRPGPAHYYVTEPKSPQSNCGPKAKRFEESSGVYPGPADHLIKRLFDLPEPPSRPCHVKLPEPAFFGIKAQRFKPRKEVGASPASYNVNDKLCNILNCSTAPFGSSTIRFKQEVIDEDEDEIVNVSTDQIFKEKPSISEKECPNPTWEFKSKTIRIRPLEKKPNEPSPADLPQSRIKVSKSPELQMLAPFNTSERRMEPWYDWLPIFGSVKTPVPCYYSLEKPRCPPAVKRGPLFRAPRFPSPTFETPAPNEYRVGGGVENVLETHNNRLKKNIENQHKFHWEPPLETKKLTPQEQEEMLLSKSIALLEGGMFDEQTSSRDRGSEATRSKITPEPKTKMLRFFLYAHKFKKVT